ncbi:MAG: hypothetical protein ACYC7G_04625, partial [Rudaea sp.]
APLASPVILRVTTWSAMRFVPYLIRRPSHRAHIVEQVCRHPQPERCAYGANLNRRHARRAAHWLHRRLAPTPYLQRVPIACPNLDFRCRSIALKALEHFARCAHALHLLRQRITR